MTELHTEQSKSDKQLLDTAFVGAQHGMMIRAAWVFVPVAMVNLALIASVAIDQAPWWLVFGVPSAVILICGHELYGFHRDSFQTLSIEQQHQRLKSQSWRSVAVSAIVALWALALSLKAPQLAYFCAAVTGFLAVGTVTYVAYLQVPMRCILIAAGLPLILLVFARHDYISFVIAFCYASNAMLLELYLSSHFSTFSGVVAQHFEAQEKNQDSKRAQAEITHIANTDYLTGVANRRGFLTTVETLISQRSLSRSSFALGVIDLDGFKPVNDCFGHAAGDLVLIEVARRMVAQVGDRGVVARIGGDEFAILIRDPQEPGEIVKIGNATIKSLSEPIEVDTGMFAQVSASCGFAVFPEGGTSPSTLLEHADEALYEVKGRHRSTAAIYDNRNEKNVLRRATIEQRLRRAIDRREIHLEFQPIVSAKSGRLLSYEALARWRDAEEGPISPGEFIPIAETCGLIGQLSRQLLQQALETAATWPEDIGLSFNLSAANLAEETFGLQLQACLIEAAIAPSRLTIEITETAFATNYDRVCDTLISLRQSGVRVAMDDFGIGYSSFANLDRLPVDVLKLDRAFIATCTTDDRRRHIVAAIVEMCQKLDLFCVAEGIEEQAQLDLVAQMGCNAVQGYLLGRPARPEALTHEHRHAAA